MQRSTVLWSIVAFFGATVAFQAIQSATEDSPVAVTLALELLALAAIIAAIVLVVRRQG